MSPRSIRRWKWRYEKEGYDGLYDRRTKRPGPRRVPMDKAERVLRLYRERYGGWNVKHFHERLKDGHGITLSYGWVKAALQGAGLVEKEKRREPHRMKRERRPLAGMMLFLDGSDHEWIAGRRDDLMLMLDDATSEACWAELVEEEDTAGSLRAIRGVVEQKGLFCSLYTDRGSHFFHTPKADGPVDKSKPTQLGAVLARLGIEHIPSYSPEARGRIERMFGTWQGRLPQELKAAGITTREEANAYIRDHFLGRMNREFSVKAREAGTAFVTCRLGDLDEAFSLQSERTVEKDNTVNYEGRRLQILPVGWRSSLARCVVKVCEALDGRVWLRYGPHKIAVIEKLEEGAKKAA